MIKKICIVILIFSVFLPSMKIQAAYRDTQGKVHLKPGRYQTLDKLGKSEEDMVREFTEGQPAWVKSGHYSYEFLDNQKEYITIRKIDSEAVQGRRLVVPQKIDGHPVIGIGLWTNWFISAYEKHYRVIEQELDISELILPEGLEFLGEASFRRCFGLKKITFPKSLVIIRAGALYDCPIGEMELPSGVYVEDGALDGSGIDIEGDDNGGLPYHGCFPWKITMFSDSLISFSNTWSADWGWAELHIRYHEKDDYSLDLPGYIEKLYIDNKLLKFRLGMVYEDNQEENNRRKDYQVSRLIMNGKNTGLELYKRKEDELPFSGVKGLYTVKGAVSIKGAKKCRIPIYWKTTGKMKKVKGKKTALAKKKGLYRADWKKIKTTVHRYYFSTGMRKWKVKKSLSKTVYKVYGKAKKNGSYKLIKTTKKRSIQSKYKYIKVVPVKEWD